MSTKHHTVADTFTMLRRNLRHTPRYPSILTAHFDQAA